LGGSLAFVAILVAMGILAGAEPLWLAAPYIPFEPLIGAWLVAKGLAWREPHLEAAAHEGDQQPVGRRDELTRS